MINLVKNELTKIFHKKGIYLYVAFILVVFGLIIAFDSDSSSVKPPELVTYKETEEHLSTFDLNNPDDVIIFIGEKVNVEVGKILEKYNIYDYNSVEYYYVSNEIKPVLETLYYNEYKFKNEEAVAMYQEELNELVANIGNFDWKSILKEDKEELKAELDSAETDSEKKVIEDKILAIDYRIRNDVAPSYGGGSRLVDQFLLASSDYHYIDKDKENMKHAEKVAIQEKEKTYYEYKYKIENDWLIKKSFDEIFYIFSGVSMDILLAIILIAGGIVAEEFNKGTIKQLFVKPYSRWKILTSKIVAAFIAFLAFVVFYVIATVIVETILGADIKTLFDTIPVYNFNTKQVVEYSSLAYLGINFLAILPEYIFYLVVCVFVGVITTNTVASIAAVFALQLVPVLITFPDNIAAYLPFNNFNFNQYLFGGMAVNGYQTLWSSIAIAFLTIALLMIIMFYIFKKKDVKNQ